MKFSRVLVLLEPWLGKKIVEPIFQHMHKIVVKLLHFVCIQTMISDLTDYGVVVKFYVEKLKDLMMEDDPNLKYLALQALANLKLNNI